ncbi:hypothetical protein MN608_11824 [Microdochium nivale]|nr:hypothetical protein MN608_11824 [Microdochium nivale]
MKFISALTFAASVSAAALEARQRTELQITEFYASCIPHSSQCNYQFSVTSDPSLPASHCSATKSSSAGVLPTVGEAGCEDNSAYTWGIVSTQQNGGYRFGVTVPLNARVNITYCHTIQPNEIETIDGGAVQTQTYIGPKDFPVTVDGCF